VEDRAWLLTHMAHLRMLEGKLELADGLAAEALKLFPGYHYAQFHLAKLRTMQGKHAEAADLLQERYRTAPHPENLFDLAVALDRVGRKTEAAKAFREFESAARAESENADNANRELIFYYTDHAKQPAAALAVAQREAKRRRDIHTLHAVAWALYCNGKDAEARREIEAALKVGVRDARIFFHAGLIAARQKDTAAAQRYFSASLAVNPRSEVAEEVNAAMAARTASRGSR
jgi:tetratricopeptide (TPR) repeat protein